MPDMQELVDGARRERAEDGALQARSVEGRRLDGSGRSGRMATVSSDEDRGEQQEEAQHADHASFRERGEVIVVRLLDEWSLRVDQPRLRGARALLQEVLPW